MHSTNPQRTHHVRTDAPHTSNHSAPAAAPTGPFIERGGRTTSDDPAVLVKFWPDGAAPALARPGMVVYGGNDDYFHAVIVAMTDQLCIARDAEGVEHAFTWHQVSLDCVRPDLPPVAADVRRAAEHDADVETIQAELDVMRGVERDLCIVRQRVDALAEACRHSSLSRFREGIGESISAATEIAGGLVEEIATALADPNPRAPRA